MLGVRWHRVKDAVETRRKMDEEARDVEKPGGYHQVTRAGGL